MILKDRVAIVTGAGSGIGRGGAEIMAREGAFVVVADLSPERSEETAEIINKAGGRAESRPTDVTDNDALERLIRETHAAQGRIDILHSHAGIQVEGTLEEVTVEGLDESFGLNLRPHFIAARAVVPYMKAQGGGSIVNTSSNSGVFLDKGMLAYITTKAAVIMMTKQIALDFRVFFQFSKMRRTFGNYEFSVALCEEIDVFIVAEAAHQVYRIGLTLVEMTGLFDTEARNL
jgi:NAD(P)-dependent dehydrogenase (short-subunit alcohol dehydrogenase family)